MGRDLDEAFRVAVIVEDVAKIYIMSRNLGDIREIPEDKVKILREMIAKKFGVNKKRGK